jgi:hypothetical protein
MVDNFNILRCFTDYMVASDITFYYFNIVSDISQIGSVTGGKIIQNPYSFASLEKLSGYVAAYETCTACNQMNTHGLPLPI